MNETLIHRGPDGGNTWINGQIGLGHRRLSIIDLSDNGRQPMASTDNQYCLSYNGEVYNFPSLREQFLGDEPFLSSSDTEVILKLLIRRGVSSIELLDGMFAFCFVDLKQNLVVLGRDPFGIKPLYYSLDNDRLIFGSEIKALRASQDISSELDIDALNDYFDFMWIPEPRSIFKDIRKLPAGHFLTLSIDTWEHSITRYWEPAYNPIVGRSDNQWIEEAENVIQESVNRHLIADVPVGSFLSGGIDSSLITSAAHMASPSVAAFTIDFDDSEFSEVDTAKAIASKIGLSNHRIEMAGKRELDLIDYLSHFYDEPFADSSMIPSFLVCQIARKHATVCLSGDGGDELFSGYHHHNLAARFNWTRSIPDSLSQFLATGIGWFANSAKLKDWTQRLKFPGDQRLLTLARLPGDTKRLNFLSSNYQRPLGRNWIVDSLGKKLSKLPPVTQTQIFDIHFYLQNDMLTKMDRASMANSLEVRVPMLSKPVADFAFSIPEEQRFKIGREKYILRELVAKKLGRQFSNKPKRGFSIPLLSWLTGANLQELQLSVEHSEPVTMGILNCSRIKELFKNLNAKKSSSNFRRRETTNLFTLLTFVSWWNNHYSNRVS